MWRTIGQPTIISSSNVDVLCEWSKLFEKMRKSVIMRGYILLEVEKIGETLAFFSVKNIKILSVTT